MDVILKSSLAGFAYALLLGPMFIAALRTSLERDYRTGLTVIAGSFASDLLLAMAGSIGASGLANLISQPNVQQTLALLCGVVLTGFGVSALVTKPKLALGPVTNGKNIVIEHNTNASVYRWSDFTSGFVLNMLNPTNWFFWCGLASAFQLTRQGDLALGGALTAVVLADCLKIVLLYQLSLRLRPEWVHWCVRGAAAVMLLLGVTALSQWALA